VGEDWGAKALYLGYEDELSMLLDMYVTKGMSCREIAERVSMGQPTVLRRLRLAGIERRGRGGPQSEQRQWHRLHMLDQRYVFTESLSKLAKRLRVSVSLVYKFKRGVKSGLRTDSTDARSEKVSQQP
jgi:transposase